MMRYLVLSILMFAAPAFAAGAESMDLLTTLGSLIFVVALIFVLAALLKKMQLPAMGNQKGLKIVRQLPVGTKERIAVVQVGDEQFVVGITPHAINLISRLDEPLDSDVPEVTPFAKQFKQLLKKDEKK